MSDIITRRQFIQALALSVLAAGMPLPTGLPKEAREPWYWYALTDEDGAAHGHMTSNHPYHLLPDAAPAKRLTKHQYDQLVVRFENRRQALESDHEG